MVDDKIRFACVSCGKRLAVGRHLAGQAGKCPACGNVMVVPSPIVTLEMASKAAPNKTDLSEIVRRVGLLFLGGYVLCMLAVVAKNYRDAPLENAMKWTVVFIAVILYLAIIAIPAIIARVRRHPQVSAIDVACIVSAAIPIFWCVAIVWAFYQSSPQTNVPPPSARSFPADGSTQPPGI